MILRRKTHQDAGAHRLGGSGQGATRPRLRELKIASRRRGHTQARTGAQS
jgi:hypothetical protein